jgi:hypothetical protein
MCALLRRNELAHLRVKPTVTAAHTVNGLNTVPFATTNEEFTHQALSEIGRDLKCPI